VSSGRGEKKRFALQCEKNLTVAGLRGKRGSRLSCYEAVYVVRIGEEEKAKSKRLPEKKIGAPVAAVSATGGGEEGDTSMIACPRKEEGNFIQMVWRSANCGQQGEKEGGRTA